MANSIPNQAVILQLFALQEAKLSSEIENIVTTDDDLYRAFAESLTHIEPQTKEVIRYKDALWHGYNAITKEKCLLSTPLFEELAKILATQGAGLRTLPGIKLVNSIGKTMYTPPEVEEVIRNLLHNLSEYIYANNGIDPLIKLAVIHYQFEAIHPFYDGNGRTGRILNILYLIENKLIDKPILYLSRYIIDNKADYYTLLRDVSQKEDWESWILYMLDAVYQTAKFTKQPIEIVQNLIRDTKLEMQTQLPKIYSHELLNILFQRPYCRIKFLEEEKIAARQTAALYLQKLEAIGILSSIKRGRERYYLNKRLLAELNK